MRLFPKVQDNEINLLPQPKLEETRAASELYSQRYFLILAGVSAILLLLGWGYVVMPRNGLGFWVWLVLALATIAGFSYFFQRQLKVARKALEGQLPATRFRLPVGLVIILGIGLAANLVVIFANPQPLKFDAWGYSDQGYDIAHQGYKADAIRTPGYPIFVAVVYKLAGGEQPQRDPYYGLSDPPNRNMKALWLSQALLLSLTALFVYLLVSELTSSSSDDNPGNKRIYWGKPLPLLAAALVAFCPFLWSYTGTPQTEISAAFWLTIAVYFWAKALRSPGIILYYGLCGLALAWTLETRPTFVYLPLLVIVSLVLLQRGRWRIFGPVLLAFPLGLMLVPPFAANLRDWAEPTPLIAGDLSTYQTTLGTLNVIRGAFRHQLVTTPASERMSEADKERLRDYVPIQQGPDKAKRHTESDYWKQYFSDYVKANPLEYAGTMLRRAWYQWDQHFVFPYYDPAYWDYRPLTDNLNRLYLIFALFGLGIAIFQRRYRKLFLPLYLSIFYLMGLNLLVQDEFRYTLPAYPLMLAFAAVGIWQAGKIILAIIKPDNSFPEFKIYRQGNLLGRNSKFILPITGFVGSALLIAGLSFVLPLIPATNAAHEKALDAVAASKDQTDGCYYSSAKAAIYRGLSLDSQDSEVIKWSLQFPKEVANAVNVYSNRIQSDPNGNKGEYYRCRGDAYRVLGQNAQAKADFQLYLKNAPTNARDRNRVETWLKELS